MFCLGVYTGAPPDDEFRKITAFGAIRASTFKLTCVDPNVSLSFHFRIEGKGTDYPESLVVIRVRKQVLDRFPPRNVQP